MLLSANEHVLLTERNIESYGLFCVHDIPLTGSFEFLDTLGKALLKKKEINDYQICKVLPKTKTQPKKPAKEAFHDMQKLNIDERQPITQTDLDDLAH